jgi:hypothetical protein
MKNIQYRKAMIGSARSVVKFQFKRQTMSENQIERGIAAARSATDSGLQ